MTVEVAHEYLAYLERRRAEKWPDRVIALAQTIFVVSLLPTLFGENKPEFITCVMTALPVFAMVIALARLRQWIGATSCAVVALEWIVLAVQTWP